MDGLDYFHEFAGAGVRRGRGLNARALTRVLSYANDFIDERLTLDALASAACMSRFHFARLFRASTGQSPMAYVLQLRIERAKEMLLDEHRGISDIAVSLGFCDHSHFTRHFRKATGVAPRDYARKQP